MTLSGDYYLLMAAMRREESLRRDLGHAVTSDGYTVWLQPDGGYANSDFSWPSAAALIDGTGHAVRFYPAP